MIRENKLIINAVFLVTITGMVFIYPFDGYFRFTLGVVVLTTVLLYIPQLPPVWTASLAGISIFLFRTILHAPFGMQELMDFAAHNFPAVVYYLSYGLWFRFLRVREYIDNMPMLILLLSITDIASNCLEILVRGETTAQNVDAVFTRLATMGICRAVIAVYGYYAIKRYHSVIMAQEQLERYAEMTAMIADLKSELFYLKKSSQVIENVMEKSYSLYQQLHEEEDDNLHDPDSYASQALGIAREIHEVKKDYYRVATGIEHILEQPETPEGMKLSEIFLIMEQNFRRWARGEEREIDISFSYETDFPTKEHYKLVSILNNLITNAAEACKNDGLIQVRQRREGSWSVFVVEDNGCGIKKSDWDVVFRVGYSTKFCPYTGKMSTGLGLAHVRDMTEMLQGSIQMDSQPGRYTCFIVRIPLEQLVVESEVSVMAVG